MGADTKKLDVAAATNIELLEYLYNEGYHLGVIVNANARAGNIKVLQWAHSKDFIFDERTCAFAAESGYMDIIQWLHEKGCPWDKRTTWVAAHNGHLDILKWILEKDCQYDMGVCARSAFGGHLEMIKWLHETCSFAASVNKLHVLLRHVLVISNCLNGLEKMDVLGMSVYVDSHSIANIFHIFEWCLENGCPWTGF